MILKTLTSSSMASDFWRDRSVFLTGCTGFLGSALTSELITRGARVVGLVRDHVADSPLARAGHFAKINVVYGDLGQLDVIERSLGEYEVDTVFHLAAQAIVGVANRNPVATFEANIQGTWNVLEACRRLGTLKHIVVASSDKAYGDQIKLPYDEETPLQGKHPYDVSKSCADLISLAYHNTYRLPVSITRCGNLFGGGDLNFNRIVPGTIKTAFEGRQPIIRSDGSPLRDYIYVKDAVSAYLRLAEAMDEPSVQGQAFNFGTARPLSVLEITNKILALVGREDLHPVVLNEAKGEILHQYLSSDKSQRLLGWEPVASIDAALLETIGWYREFLAGRGA
jgi:CDP-glucose 4,6-dehydratase